MVPPIFQDTRWLGGKHNGYKRVPLEEYLELRRSSEDEDSSLERAATLQCLMTFGLLEAVVEEEIREERLVRLNSSGEQVVTSEHLPDMLLRFRHRFLNLQGNDRAGISGACRKWAKRIEAALIYASTAISSECMKWKYNAFWSSDLEPVILAEVVIQMGSIFEAVRASIQGLFELEGGEVVSWHKLVPSECLNLIISPGGWCAAIADDIVGDGNACILGYACTLKCPPSRSSEGHEECNIEKCLVSKKDTSEYAPKHVSESCRCKNSMPSLKDVTRLLQDSKIPVVDVGLSVKESSNTPYVAISHVWSDGLRGTTDTGLPACQVERLAILSGLILGTGVEGAFWIDTLCIPELDDMSHRAIGLMGRVYKEAEAVLVIDSGIRDISVSASDEERLFNVVYSRWMQRLWTFQEAALAKELYFQFSDAVVPMRKLLMPIIDSHIREINAVGYHLLEKFFARSMLSLYHSKPSLAQVSLVLRERTVSIRSDELLAVCSVLDLDGFKLARESDLEKRMCDFLLQIKKLPAEIIFNYLPCEERVDKDGFRWAPKTFLPQDRNSFATLVPPGSSDNFGAVCTPSGLEAEYDAITEGVEMHGNKRAWYIKREGGKVVYKVSPVGNSYEEPVNVLSCNILLVDTSYDGGLPNDTVNSPLQCVGLWVDPESVDGGRSGGDRILCKFRVLLVLDREFNEMEESEVMIVGSELRRIKVKLV